MLLGRKKSTFFALQLLQWHLFIYLKILIKQVMGAFVEKLENWKKQEVYKSHSQWYHPRVNTC